MLNIVQYKFVSVFGRVATPPVEHAREVMQLQSITDSLQAKAIGDALEGTQAAGLRQMIDDAKAKRLSRLEELVVVANVIEKADLMECKHIINTLAERVSELTGSAAELEDAACALTAAMEAQDLIDNPPLCGSCNGSGEGQHEGTTCHFCRGSGVVKGEA